MTALVFDHCMECIFTMAGSIGRSTNRASKMKRTEMKLKEHCNDKKSQTNSIQRSVRHLKVVIPK